MATNYALCDQLLHICSSVKNVHAFIQKKNCRCWQFDKCKLVLGTDVSRVQSIYPPSIYKAAAPHGYSLPVRHLFPQLISERKPMSFPYKVSSGQSVLCIDDATITGKPTLWTAGRTASSLQ